MHSSRKRKILRKLGKRRRKIITVIKIIKTIKTIIKIRKSMMLLIFNWRVSNRKKIKNKRTLKGKRRRKTRNSIILWLTYILSSTNRSLRNWILKRGSKTKDLKKERKKLRR